MPTIFVSYRRDDTQAIAGRIFDRLTRRYGKQSIFMDIDIKPGADFRENIKEILGRCDIVLAVVGSRWMGPNGGALRIDNEGDWVRIEVESALQRQITVIPVLVDGASMPSSTELPVSLRQFSFRQAIAVHSGQDFNLHIKRLIRSINQRFREILESSPTAPPSALKASLQDDQPDSLEVLQSSTSHPADNAVNSRSMFAAESPTEGECSSRDRHLFGHGSKRLLAFDSGGIRGIISIAFLQRIEVILAERAGNETRLSDWFDLIGGTSMATITACGVALGLGAGQLKDFYQDVAARVFVRSRWHIPLLRPTFDGAKLSRCLDALIGDRTLDSSDLRTGLCIVAKRMDTGSPWIVANNPRAPYWESSFDKSYVGNRHLPLQNLVRASIAAPNLLEPELFPISDDSTPGLFIDGGMSPYKNPTLALLMLATLKAYGIKWPLGLDNLAIVSIGCGTYRRRFGSSSLRAVKHRMSSLHALASLVEDSEMLALTLLQWLGDSQARWFINSEIGDLASEGLPNGSLFRFQRYDVRLEAVWLKEFLDLTVTEHDLARVRENDDPEIIPLAYEIGRRAAELQVKAEDFIR